MAIGEGARRRGGCRSDQLPTPHELKDVGHGDRFGGRPQERETLLLGQGEVEESLRNRWPGRASSIAVGRRKAQTIVPLMILSNTSWRAKSAILLRIWMSVRSRTTEHFFHLSSGANTAELESLLASLCNHTVGSTLAAKVAQLLTATHSRCR